MSKNNNIFLAFILLFSVLTFSSFSFTNENVNIKIEKSDNQKEQKKEIKLIEFEAMMSVTSFVIPVQFAEVFIQIFSLDKNEWVDHYFEPKSQEFYRIFFTHIISKNAP